MTTSDIVSNVITRPGVSASWETKLYPNPANNWIYIDFPETENSDYSVQILTMNGKLILQEKILKGINRYEMSTEDLPNGLYFVRFSIKIKYSQ
ncbi:MAG: T9SS type A sorting domain-containing protein [Bacteroidales bacterium]|nr:T9SS type A sorting domain-containing protein [Bacteroidales bacterium]